MIVSNNRRVKNVIGEGNAGGTLTANGRRPASYVVRTEMGEQRQVSGGGSGGGGLTRSTSDVVKGLDTKAQGSWGLTTACIPMACTHRLGW